MKYRKKGFNLIEVMMYLFLFSIFLLIISNVFNLNLKIFNVSVKKTDSFFSSVNILSKLSTDLINAKMGSGNLIGFSTTQDGYKYKTMWFNTPEKAYVYCLNQDTGVVSRGVNSAGILPEDSKIDVIMNIPRVDIGENIYDLNIVNVDGMAKGKYIICAALQDVNGVIKTKNYTAQISMRN